jgi:uncharacterized zinc-type alcohol dehydrogenase-like protein
LSGENFGDDVATETSTDSRRSFLKLTAGSAAVTALFGETASAQGKPTAAASPASAYSKRTPARGYAFFAENADLKPFKFERRPVGANDVAIDIKFCGVCHSDIHTARGHWGPQRAPQVTGHEISGLVVAVGSGVSNFKVGDRVGVGCMVNSCRTCSECQAGFEQYCENGPTMTYGSTVDDSVEPSGTTQGGYSNAVVVDKNYVIRIPDGVDLAAAGPIMCSAVTVYSPLRHWNIRKGSKVGIIGLGGLGHIGVKIAKAMGAEVVVFTTTEAKIADAKRFGASDVILNNDPEKIRQYKRHFDFILDTASYHHDLDPAMTTLKRDATLCLVGIGDIRKQPNQIGPFMTIVARNSFAGSMIGSIRETQEVVDFCDLHNVSPDITKVSLASINETWSDVIAKKARYRYVVDMTAA